jgi:tetratricopeptide (TPR) repeat protein
MDARTRQAPRITLTLALILAVAVTLAPALAAGRGTPSATDRKARALFLEGERHYAAKRYREAIELFERAYTLSERAGLLYNLGNAYERIGDAENAVKYLRLYLKSPRARGRITVQERIRRLEETLEQRRLEEQKAREQRPPPASGPSSRPSPRPSPGPPAPAPGRSNLPAYLLLAGGALALSGALAFGIVSLNAGGEAEELCTSGGLCRDEARDALDRERSFALATDICIGVGVVAAGVGAYLLFRGRGRERAHGGAPTLTPTVVSGGAVMELSGVF